MNRPTFMQHINRRLNARRNGEGGLALLDVLLGMAIFALIAVIAVQAMGQFRERAFVTQMTSDVKQASTAIEAAMTEPNQTFAAVIGAAPTGTNLLNARSAALGFNPTAGSRVFLLGVTGTNETNYVLCVDKGMDGPNKSVRYNAATGSVGNVEPARCSNY